MEPLKKAEGVAVSRLERHARTPIELPNPDDILKLVFDLERGLSDDIVAGREELLHHFQGGRIDLVPKTEGFDVARSKLLPLTLLVRPPSEASQGGRCTAVGCAGRI